jgi:CRISPR-associated protein (TIGR03986 family)
MRRRHDQAWKKTKGNKEWVETEERFVNPYNFVPLEGKCDRKSIKKYVEGKKRLTGYIECTITTLTPLIIPNTSNDKALHGADSKDDFKEGNSYDFYSYTNLEKNKPGERLHQWSMPVIPGSEICGTIRSVFEAAFNGCLSSIDLERTLHRRSLVPKTPGILRKSDSGWEIVKCERVMLNTGLAHVSSEKKDRIKDNRSNDDISRFGKYVSSDAYSQWQEGDVISVIKSNETFKTRNGFYDTGFYVAVDYAQETRTDGGWKSGFLHKGEPFSRKHHESVFIPSDPEVIIPVDAKEVELLCEVLRQYADNKINKHKDASSNDNGQAKHSGYVHLKNPLEKLEIGARDAQMLVYYSTYQDGSVIKAAYLAPAMISKEVYHRTLKEILEAHGEYQPCETREDVCPACALFGMVGDSAIGSRLRFSDATVVGQEADASQYYRDYVLPEMGEPKPGTVEFYTDPPDGVEKHKGDHSYYMSWSYDYVWQDRNEFRLLDKKEIRLRGRKFYWHNDNLKVSRANSVAKMRQRVRAVKEGVIFSFRVYFDRITEEELAHLHWALTFNDAGCAHKFGKGKPLGFGSGVIRIEGSYVRELDQQTGLRMMQRFDIPDLDDLSETQKKLKKIASWENRPASVGYPYAVGNNPEKTNNEGAHQWFSANRKNNRFLKVLPTIDEELDDTYMGKWLVRKKSSNNQNQTNPSRQESDR